MPSDSSFNGLSRLSDSDLLQIRKACLRSLYCFAKTVLGYDDIIEEVHGEFCRFLERPEVRKQGTLPRSFVKTWLGTIAYSIWIALPRTEPDDFPTTCIFRTTAVDGAPTALDLAPRPVALAPSLTGRLSHLVPLPGYSAYLVDPLYLLCQNIRILIASYVIGNSMKMLNLIRMAYERNQAMMILFPEVIPENFTKVKWSNLEACVNRSGNFTESTFEAGGIGGSTTSRHYDIIIEDDLIYANKDDFTGRELQPNQDDIDKAIGWHKLAMSLLVPGTHTKIHNIGTRWAKHDLVEYIRSNEHDYIVFEKAITKDYTVAGEPTWPKMYPKDQIRRIYEAQGPYMFATQYLCKPMAPEDMLFKVGWLDIYKTTSEIPQDIKIYTTIDLSLWSESKQKAKAKLCRGVILTCGWTPNNHVWLMRYDVGRFNPSEVIDLLYVHYRLYKPLLMGVETVYYQQALLHFATLEMEKRGWLPIRELDTSTRITKDMRIRGLEPYAMNGAVHCRADMQDFITEFAEYVPESDLCPKDILDTLAYQLQLARPGDAKEVRPARNYKDYTFQTDMDKFLLNIWSPSGNRGIFAEHELRETTVTQEEDPFIDLMQPLENFDN